MRLFVAVNFNDDTRTKLMIMRDELRSRSKKGSFSRPENMHLTLAFLGECNTSQTNSAKAAMDSIQFDPFYLKIDRTGRFRRDSGDIWWAGVRCSEAITKLHNDLRSALEKEGFETEKRKYDPHITLGRDVRTSEEQRSVTEFGEMINEIELMCSERIDGMLTYTSIHKRKASQ